MLPTGRGHRARPASRTGHGATLIYVLGTEKRAGAGGWAAHRGHHTPMAPGTRLVSPPQAWLPCRMPHGLAPGAAPAGHRGMNREKGQGCASTILPLAKDPKQPQPSGGSPRAAEAGEGPCRAVCGSRDRGIPVFLPFCPSHATGLLVSHLGRTPPATSSGSPRGRPGAPARSAAGIKPAALPPLSSPRPPRATPRGGAACTPLGQTAKEPKT